MTPIEKHMILDTARDKAKIHEYLKNRGFLFLYQDTFLCPDTEVKMPNGTKVNWPLSLEKSWTEEESNFFKSEHGFAALAVVRIFGSLPGHRMGTRPYSEFWVMA